MARNHVTAAGAFAGIVTGVAITTILTFTKTTIGSVFPGLPEVIRDLNVGIIALIGNVVVMLVVSAVTQSRVVAAAAG
jgi:SSS family solute:Na+ symporter